MIKTFIYSNMYQDSIKLMLLSQNLKKIDGVIECSIAMATPNNLDILKAANLLTEDSKKASPDDIILAVSATSEDAIMEAKKYVDDDFEGLHSSNTFDEDDESLPSKTIQGAEDRLAGADITLISVPGQYATELAHKAIDMGINPMIFSDNVELKDELALKQRADEKGLIVMGPDCGTSIISGFGLGFANKVQLGPVGIVGASGTGIQEIISLIDSNDVGISHAIGTGGRDLDAEIGGISTLKGIEILGDDSNTDIICIVSKPAEEKVLKSIEKLLERKNKPSVIIAIGMDCSQYQNTKLIKYADTLKTGAEYVLEYLNKTYSEDNVIEIDAKVDGQLCGLYTGGTMAYEALHILSKDSPYKLYGNIRYKDIEPIDDIFNPLGNVIIDLGEDELTSGRAHPMINSALRNELIEIYAKKEDVELILLDFVLGYGSNEDPVGTALPSILKNREIRKKLGYKEVVFLAHVCGTKEDVQNYDCQVKKLVDANISVFGSNVSMIKHAKQLQNNMEVIK